MKLIELFWERRSELLDSFFIHIEMTLISVIIATFIAVPVGIWLAKNTKYKNSIIGTLSVIQTIPSLALLGFMIPLFGIGKEPALIAFVLYALLPILRNTYLGISGVSPAYIEAGTGMGMTRWQLLFMVQLPISFSVLIGGIRTATVWTVGVATLGALVGAGGLGDFIFRGINTANSELILLGAIPAALLALFFDFILEQIEKKYTIKER